MTSTASQAQTTTAQGRYLSIRLRDSELLPTTQISNAKRWNFLHFGLPYDQVSHVNPDGSLSLPNGMYAVAGQMVVSVADANLAQVSINRSEPNLAASGKDAFYDDPYYFKVATDHGGKAGNVIIPFSGMLQLTTWTDFAIYTSTNVSLQSGTTLFIFPVI
ncbi:hypothetical protein P9250_19210 [Caballeronia sp. LP006]|uniref:hypothetical protein n=1 Tax=Caballeronia sp. LP006 TaxID=3038552 RepID=UPI002855B554|nr:hypothetical protein [Caballeronia sp. LP006]MDR5830006.1 hypothetical protein [Caballeronia sp. LP006]